MKVCYLPGKRNFDPDPTFVIHFLKLLQTSGKDQIYIRAPVVDFHLGEPAARTHTLDDRIGYELPRVSRPAVVVIKSEFFGRFTVNNRALPEVTG